MIEIESIHPESKDGDVDYPIFVQLDKNQIVLENEDVSQTQNKQDNK